MIEYGSKHEEYKFEFKIEQLPDGTFVGRSEKPQLEIKGASPQEIQEKIQHMMGSGILKRLLGVDMTTAMTGHGIEVKMERSGDAGQQKVALNAMFRLGSTEAPKLEGTDPQMTTPEAIDAGSVRAQRLLFWVVVLALVGLVVWWLLR